MQRRRERQNQTVRPTTVGGLAVHHLPEPPAGRDENQNVVHEAHVEQTRAF